MSGLFAITCFVSPNPSPMHWMVSGAEADVAAIVAAAPAPPAGRLVARAAADGIAFARFELDPHLSYRDIGGLIFEAQRRGMLISLPQPLMPSCTGGGIEDVGDSFSPVIVGLIGGEAAIAAARDRLGWARLEPVRFTDGRAGLAFRPDPEQLESYEAFVAEAAAGAIAGLEVVLLHPAD